MPFKILLPPYNFLALSNGFVFQFFTSPLQLKYITWIVFLFHTFHPFVLKSSCLNSHENCWKMCVFCVFVKRSSILHTFSLHFWMQGMHFLTKKRSFYYFFFLTNCSLCNPKVHNNKKIRVFSSFLHKSEMAK